MSYYRAGGVVRTGRSYRVRFAGRRGGYYMAGGFFSKLRHGIGKLAHFATHTAAGNMLLGAAAGAVGLGGVYALAGRVSGMFSHTAAPSGIPTEGTPAMAQAGQLATYKSDNHAAAVAYLAAILRKMNAAKRRRFIAAMRG